MLIPSIDLKNGRIVQLVQGKKQVLESNDIKFWIRKFQHFPLVQLIDLDAAMDSGTNDSLVKHISAQLPCRVGGGIRTLKRASEVLAYGATAVIVGSSLFKNGRPNINFARLLADTIGIEKIIAAVDSKGGSVVIKGWKEKTSLTAVEAVCELEPYCGSFLYTHVDKEGLMQGTDFEAILKVRQTTKRHLAAAGGITTQAEIDQLDQVGIDAVVGMAIYTGRLRVNDP